MPSWRHSSDTDVRQWGKFVAGSLVGLGVNVGSYTLLTSLVAFFTSHRLAALLVGVVLGTLFNFLLANLYVYRRQSGRPSIGASRQ